MPSAADLAVQAHQHGYFQTTTGGTGVLTDFAGLGRIPTGDFYLMCPLCHTRVHVQLTATTAPAKAVKALEVAMRDHLGDVHEDEVT